LVADNGREIKREITGARAKISYGVPCPQVERAKNVGRTLPLVALRLDCVKLAKRVCKGVKGAQT
jgi:hypothetical protein